MEPTIAVLKSFLPQHEEGLDDELAAVVIDGPANVVEPAGRMTALATLTLKPEALAPAAVQIPRARSAWK